MSATAPDIESFLPTSGGELVHAEAEVAKRARDYWAASREHLIALHRGGASGSRLCETHADLVDRLVRHLFRAAEEGYFAASGGQPSPLTVVALGGYARREMNLHSDVDLLFLYGGAISRHIEDVSEKMLRWLWDADLQVGGATRTAADTVALARKDPSVQTAVLDPRFLAGSGVLFHDFATSLRRTLCADPRRFIAERREAMAKRHTGQGDTPYLLQPNVKEGQGGLRDYHEATWCVQVTQPGSRGFEAFLHLGLLTEQEVAEYRASVDFLWRVRNELHARSGRKHDQLDFDLQERIAEDFGYADAGPGEADLPVERFMRDYYRSARGIQNYSSLVVEQCHARVKRTLRRRKVREVGEGFRVADGQLEIPQARRLRENPVLLLTAFAVAQDEDVPLTRKARRLVRENLDRIDDAFRASPEARDAFLRILSAEKRVTSTLLAMNEVGLLARYLPEWEHIVCRWQHVMYHAFTVDVHSIFLVEELRRLWIGEYRERFPQLTELIHTADDLPVLFLGCLLHDLGKGFGGDHSTIGEARARACLSRIGLEPERVERVAFLVRLHLLMSHLAQRRDLSDPKLIFDFAQQVGDRVNLRNLYLVTFADVRASSKRAWTDWKGQLLRELFERTAELLEAGSDDPSTAIELIEKRVETRRAAAGAELTALGFGEAKVEAYFEMMPRRYFTAHTPRQIARHARVVFRLGADAVSCTAVREMRGGFSEFIVCTRDAPGLFAQVAGVLTAHQINILGAHVYTTRTGLALEVYRLTTPEGGEEERRLIWSELEASIEQVLRGELDVAELLRRRGRPVGIAKPPSEGPVAVGVSNEESEFYTIVDVTANDRLGLLHDLTRALAEQGCEVYISKAATILDQVTDAFYVKDRAGEKVQGEAARARLREALLVAAQREEGEADGGA